MRSIAAAHSAREPRPHSAALVAEVTLRVGPATINVRRLVLRRI
jgi:hypothetical protein